MIDCIDSWVFVVFPQDESGSISDIARVVVAELQAESGVLDEAGEDQEMAEAEDLDESHDQVIHIFNVETELIAYVTDSEKIDR